jgi:hypothetical protein|tara:strand:+ start:387 stop:575 length:189 start_codon:yes stop_codon:yes gene_type:complete
MQQQFIPITVTIDTELKTVFINVNLVQSVYQLDADIIIEMTNQQQYMIVNTNLQVFMDRFKQ